ncbi:hypothetical protein [Erythrobacter ani]|uniref:Uncharacterized protein n=1 Tax=Erythrobacter ani TaxID=2827235 RepID=A0ABS6SN40_9SPHN|nr:hypothetical protein [Erythrobacter ani]MBV7266064.1 hypothetical protein [Erythrobacter ani]
MFELILEYRVEAQRVVSVLILLAALRWGGAPERAAAATFVLFFTLPLTAFEFFAGGPLIFSGIRIVYVALDIFALTAFLAIALNANRNYPLIIAGFQVVALVAHLVRGIVDTVSPLAYAVLVIGPSYFQLVLLACGLALHVRRRKRFGPYRDWRVPLPKPFDRRPMRDVLK